MKSLIFIVLNLAIVLVFADYNLNTAYSPEIAAPSTTV
jgi:hypothetical protein